MTVGQLIAMLQAPGISMEDPVLIFDADMGEMAEVGAIIYGTGKVELLPEGYD
jgi:hypothetical protein